jgi:hypothetical protein
VLSQLDLMDKFGELLFKGSFYASPSFMVGTTALLSVIFFWDGIDLMTCFLYPIAAGIVWVVFAMVCIGAVIKACVARQGRLLHRLRFVLFDVIVVLLAIYFPFNTIKTWCDFNFNLPLRMHVVSLVERNKLQSQISGSTKLCQLPFYLNFLSKGRGEIIITDGIHRSDQIDPSSLHIFFFTFRGILARHSGFEYSADGKPPADAKEARELDLIRPHWYWAAY